MNEETTGPHSAAPLPIVPVLIAAFMLRSLITALPPAMPQVRADLLLPETVAGLTVGLPVLCFGAFAMLTPILLRRLGAAATLTTALVVLSVGALVRPAGSQLALLLGTLGIGLGVAIGNVVVPVMIRRARPLAIPHYMGYYTVVMSIGATLGSLVTGPLLSLGVSWQVVLFGWAIVAIGFTVGWAVSSRNRDATPAAVTAPSEASLLEVAKTRRAWTIGIYMGLQSTAFYTCTTWLPTELTSVGMSLAEASVGLALFNALGILSSLYGPRLLTGPLGRGIWVALVPGYAGGMLLILVGGPFSWLGVALTGLTQGATFALALTLIARTPQARLVGSMSAFVQGVGYLIACVGPSGAGALHTVTGSWWPVQIVLACMIVTFGLLAWPLLKERHG